LGLAAFPTHGEFQRSSNPGTPWESVWLCVSGFDPSTVSSSSDHRLSPLQHKIMGRRHDYKAAEKQSQPLPVLKLWKLYLCARVSLEEKRHDIRVEYDGLYVAGSVLT
jgi:hypothetical protein